jgi:hypothetical protein
MKENPFTRELIGEVKDWHQPMNDDCDHNIDPQSDCTCKQPRKYKPYRVVRMRDNAAPHGIDVRIILHAWPNGVIELREHGRRKILSIAAGELYKRLAWGEAMAAKAAKRKKKAKK